MIRNRMISGIGVILLAAPGWAQTCPAAPDHRAALGALTDQIQRSDTEMEARGLSNRMWELWTQAPDEAAQALLDRGMRARSTYDFLGALEAFDRLVRYCPDYAEGYNQRAFVHYLSQNFDAALTDLELTLERSPRHTGALSGKALSLYALGRIEEARDVLAQALALNPWLPERSLAAPGGPLAPLGDDI